MAEPDTPRAPLLVRVRFELFIELLGSDASPPLEVPGTFEPLICPAEAAGDPLVWRAGYLGPIVQWLADDAVPPPADPDAVDPGTGTSFGAPIRGPWRVLVRPPELAAPMPEQMRAAHQTPDGKWLQIMVSSPFAPAAAQALERIRAVVAGISRRWRVLAPPEACSLAVDLVPYSIVARTKRTVVGAEEQQHQEQTTMEADPSAAAEKEKEKAKEQKGNKGKDKEVEQPSGRTVTVEDLRPSLRPGKLNAYSSIGSSAGSSSGLPPPPPPPGGVREVTQREAQARPFTLPELRGAAAFAYVTSSHIPSLLRRARHDVPNLCLSLRHRSDLAKGMTAAVLTRLWGLGPRAFDDPIITFQALLPRGTKPDIITAAAEAVCLYGPERRVVPRGRLKLTSAELGGPRLRQGGATWWQFGDAYLGEDDDDKNQQDGNTDDVDYSLRRAGQRDFSLRRAANEIMACPTHEAVAALLTCERAPGLGAVSLANYARGAAPTALGVPRAARFCNPQFAGDAASAGEEEAAALERDALKTGATKAAEWREFDYDADPAGRLCITLRYAGAMVEADSAVLWTALCVTLCRLALVLPPSLMEVVIWSCELGEHAPGRHDVLDLLAWLGQVDDTIDRLVDACQRKTIENRYLSPWCQGFQEAAKPEVIVIDDSD
jgi:hypothetical protein